MRKYSPLRGFVQLKLCI